MNFSTMIPNLKIKLFFIGGGGGVGRGGVGVGDG